MRKFIIVITLSLVVIVGLTVLKRHGGDIVDLGQDAVDVLKPAPEGPSAWPPLSTTGPGADCRITVELPDELVAGEAIQTTLLFTNDGEQAVTIVLPGDGSSSKRRPPYADWTVMSADSTEPYPLEPVDMYGAFCGNMNRIRPGTVVTVEPGQTVDLGDWMSYLPVRQAGRYRAAFHYANIPDAHIDDGANVDGHDKAEVKRIRQSTPMSLISQEVVFEVLPGPVDTELKHQ